MQEPRRPLTRAERALAYGLLGWCAEVAFTALGAAVDPATRSWRLEGHTYVWMLPIYGLVAFLFEPLHDGMRSRPVWQRAAAYATGFLAVEAGTGTALRRTVGLVPWDYTGHSRWARLHGAVRMDYAPLWALAGLSLERAHDALRELPLRRLAQAPAAD